MAIWHSLNKYRDFGLLVIRVGLGAMFIYHGYPKLMGGPQLWAGLGGSMKYVGINFAPIFWGFMAGVIESVGGLLLVLGLLFRPACLFLLINMVVAAMSHLGKGQGLGEAAHAIEDGVMFLGLFIIGPGRYSVDRR
ncbi:DoxX family protein [Mucilaginibacter terrenus]|uniref:DoxX family protein n=1 Tax=Mucilaginibacter terrenus TaxID=2482727 RepID=A0A3E2NPJ2_9SPHI|nr:DoxX family protein [Mucilaginibacter terrenus]RFZ82897.1 DoxX family protein [Mucilaginibacter terrenus]